MRSVWFTMTVLFGLCESFYPFSFYANMSVNVMRIAMEIRSEGSPLNAVSIFSVFLQGNSHRFGLTHTTKYDPAGW